MTRDIYKPGPGWKHLQGAVWEHENGVRIHHGNCPLTRDTDGDILSIEQGREHSRDCYRFIRINGGNRKRGVMAYARLLFIY